MYLLYSSFVIKDPMMADDTCDQCAAGLLRDECPRSARQHARILIALEITFRPDCGRKFG